MDASKKIIMSHRQWDSWLAMVKQTATIRQLWKYIDLDVDDPLLFEQPPAPKPQDVNPTASRVTDLNADDRELFTLLVQQHTLEIDAWSEKRQSNEVTARVHLFNHSD